MKVDKIVAIIGSNSFVGSSLVENLINRKTKLNLYETNKTNPYNSKNINYYHYNYPNNKLNYYELSKNDIIFFCSAAGVQSNNKVKDDLIFQLNSLEPLRLSLELEKLNFKGKFVTFGSYAELGINSQIHKYTEIELIKSNNLLINPYSISKKILTSYIFSRNHKINWYHLIISSLYGRCEGQHRLINYIIKCVRSDKNLVLSSGNQVRQYINIEDVSNLLLKIIYEENLPGIYNLTSDNHTTINKIVEIVLSILNQTNYPISIKERADSNMKILMTCNKKIKKQFNWKPIIELEDGIKSYLNK